MTNLRKFAALGWAAAALTLAACDPMEKDSATQAQLQEAAKASAEAQKAAAEAQAVLAEAKAAAAEARAAAEEAKAASEEAARRQSRDLNK